MSRAFVLFCLLAAFPLQIVSAESVETDFPLPEMLRPAVGFWKRVYLEVTTRAGLLEQFTESELKALLNIAPRAL